VGGWHWLQTLVLINPLIYVNEGMRAVFTNAPHLQLYVIYPVVAGFAAAVPGHRPAQLPPPRALLAVSDAFSKIGPNIRHGPHQAAQKSTSTRPSPLTVELKFSVVSSTVAIVASLRREYP
jgi:hypothetical protein